MDNFVYVGVTQVRLLRAHFTPASRGRRLPRSFALDVSEVLSILQGLWHRFHESGGDNRCSGNETMSNAVYHYAETLQGPYAE